MTYTPIYMLTFLERYNIMKHRIVAEQCWNIIEEQFPDIKIALDNIKAHEEFVRKLP